MNIINAKSEFLKETKERDILCAKLEANDFIYTLPIGYTSIEFENFLSAINFEYHNGYGSYSTQGFIWYTNGTWSERIDYDGKGEWNYQTCPDIPDECIPKQVRYNCEACARYEEECFIKIKRCKGFVKDK